MEYTLHVSKTNSKVSFPCIDLPAGITCRPDAPCYKDCYALHGRFLFQNVKEPRVRNLALWNLHPRIFEREVINALLPYRFARFHSSGDIPSDKYFRMMIRVAKACPGTQILCFTKKWGIVNDYLDNHGKLPSNLRVVFSAWGDGFAPVNPFNLPVAYVRLKKENCTIPENAMECSGFCGECVKGASCWSMGKGDCVVFNQH